ncbi:MAG: preprotein translocase subunit SecA [Candidatus Omnitrophica bacterium]|nr:preprotein translocase subunit SecA [Candidatus Omnitrophota bacterium]
MIKWITNKIFGSQNEKEVKKLTPLLEKVNGFESAVSALSDAELQAKTEEFRTHAKKREKELSPQIGQLRRQIDEATSQDAKDKSKQKLKSLYNSIFDDILPEAFAVVREAAKRIIGMRHFDVQIIGGVVLHEGRIAEMATGEGKTLVATLPVYLNALLGKGVHVITVNDYLARRDREWMGPVYEFLGLSIGVIQHDMAPQERKIAYGCDIAYGTNNEFGFDYLRDNMVIDKNDMVQREPFFAIIDEVDSILIDEARTPLIISGPADESTDKYYKIDKIIPSLKKGSRDETTKEETGDFIIDEKARTSYLTEQGEIKASQLLGLKDMHTLSSMEYKHHVNQALRAHSNFKCDVDYIVKDGKVIIVDDFTGRLMPGRRWSDGLHQAIEAKEGVTIERENQTLATITFQNYFRMYEKLAGMTGTAATESEEFSKIYKLDVVVIPPNRQLKRTNHADVVYRTEKEKYGAIVGEIEELHKEGRPVLVGTISIDKSEHIGNLLKQKGVPHNVLNAKYHEFEAHIVAQAGRLNAVTIATNMAGRGTDILLGGSSEFRARDTLAKMKAQGKDVSEDEYNKMLSEFKAEATAEHNKVVSLGGLHMIGSERHEARRIDNQLRGRAGRQGDPGSSRFYVSLEDDLMRIFASDRVARLINFFQLEEGTPIAEHKIVAKSIETAQRRVESHNFEIRKQVLEFDNVMNKQREVIYAQRRTILESDDLREHIFDMIDDLLASALDTYAPENLHPEQWDYQDMISWLRAKFLLRLSEEELSPFSREELGDYLREKIRAAYIEKEKSLGHEKMRMIEKSVLLQAIDSKWKDHLLSMDHLREGIHLRGYGQRNPLVEYQREGYDMFMAMVDSIRDESLEYIFKIQAVETQERSVFKSSQQELIHPEAESMHDIRTKAPPMPQPGPGLGPLSADDIGPPPPPPIPGEGPAEPYKREAPKVGRNDPCPCNSGKKYKKCCGK